MLGHTGQSTGRKERGGGLIGGQKGKKEEKTVRQGKAGREVIKKRKRKEGKMLR